jgi:hypothetical protein
MLHWIAAGAADYAFGFNPPYGLLSHARATVSLQPSGAIVAEQ